MKTLNVILYLPGYAGHFISLILSLDDSVYPWTSGIESPREERKDVYTFKHLKDCTVPWVTHHLRLSSSIPAFIESKYSTLFHCIHPIQYYSDLIHTIESLPNTVIPRFITLHGSDHVVKEHVHGFVERNGGFPVISKADKECFDRFLTENKPYQVDIGFLFSSEDVFLQGYEILCNDLQVTPKVEGALELYRDWREARKVNRVSETTPKEVVFGNNFKFILEWAEKHNLTEVINRIRSYNEE